MKVNYALKIASEASSPSVKITKLSQSRNNCFESVQQKVKAKKKDKIVNVKAIPTRIYHVLQTVYKLR